MDEKNSSPRQVAPPAGARTLFTTRTTTRPAGRRSCSSRRRFARVTFRDSPPRTSAGYTQTVDIQDRQRRASWSPSGTRWPARKPELAPLATRIRGHVWWPKRANLGSLRGTFWHGSGGRPDRRPRRKVRVGRDLAPRGTTGKTRREAGDKGFESSWPLAFRPTNLGPFALRSQVAWPKRAQLCAAWPPCPGFGHHCSVREEDGSGTDVPGGAGGTASREDR